MLLDTALDCCVTILSAMSAVHSDVIPVIVVTLLQCCTDTEFLPAI